MNSRALLEALRSDLPTAQDVKARVIALAKGHARRDHAATYRATLDLAKTLSIVAARADLAGRVAMRLDVRGPRPDRLAAWPAGRFASIVPVQFEEALTDLARREPVLVRPLRDAAEAVRQLYGSVPGANGELIYPHGFSLAHAIDLEVVKRVQALVGEGIATGRDVVPAVAAELDDWGLAYATTVVRTNTTTSYSAGRLREASALQDEGVDVGFEFQTAGDSDVRSGRAKDHGEDHAGVDGIRAPSGDSVWSFFTPPLGYNCRCLLVPVVGGPWNANALSEARARGAKAAPGFGGRTDG